MQGPITIEAGSRRWLAARALRAVVASTGFIGLAIGSARADPAQPLPGIEVLGHYDNAVGAFDAASGGSVNARLIEARPVLRTGELLEFVPGLIVTQHSGDGKANQYFLRGFNLDHGTDFATFVDGMPVNMRTHAHGQGYTDLNFVIPELVSRIDYRKGPYAADDGDFASAGSARLHFADRLARIASVTVGEDGYRRAVLAGSVGAGAGRVIAGFEAGANDGPWTNPEHARRASAIARYVQGDDDRGFSLTALAYAARWRSTDQIPARAVDDGTLDRYGAIDPSDGGRTSRFSLSANAHAPNALGHFHASAYAIASRVRLYSNFTYFLDDPVDGDQFEQYEKRRVFGFDVAQTMDATIGGLASETTIGVEARHDRLDPVALYRTVERTRTATTREDRVRESSVALRLENRVRWTPWLRSVAGLRVDAYRFHVDSDLPANSGRVNDHVVSPKLSFVFGPWARTEVFLNYGQGFHSNDARGVTATTAATGRDAIEPAVPLAKTHGEEIGIRTEAVPGLQSSLALWQLTLASELVFAGDAGDTEPSRASRRRGVEWNNRYVVRPWLVLDLDAALSRARYIQDDPAGNRVPGAIEKVVSFGATVAPVGPWSGHVQLRYFGPRPLIEDGSVRSASTTLASLRVSYAFTRQLKLTLDVFNLFDRKASDIDYFYVSRLRGEPPDGIADRHFHPVEPRTARLTLAGRW